MNSMLTGNKLKAIRAMKGLTQMELAARAGVSPVSIATFESGRSDIKASTIVKLCDALGITITYRLEDGTEITGP